MKTKLTGNTGKDNAMNDELLSILKDASTAQIREYYTSHPGILPVLIDYALEKGEYSWRAAYMIAINVKKENPLIARNANRIIDALEGKKQGHQRELLKILLLTELNEEQSLRLYDYCMQVWNETSHTPSLREKAFRHIISFYRKYPELSGDLDWITQEQYLTPLSPGIRKVVERLKRKYISTGSKKPNA